MLLYIYIPVMFISPQLLLQDGFFYCGWLSNPNQQFFGTVVNIPLFKKGFQPSFPIHSIAKELPKSCRLRSLCDLVDQIVGVPALQMLTDHLPEFIRGVHPRQAIDRRFPGKPTTRGGKPMMETGEARGKSSTTSGCSAFVCMFTLANHDWITG